MNSSTLAGICTTALFAVLLHSAHPAAAEHNAFEVEIPKNARTFRDFSREQRVWCERVMLKPLLQRAAGQPWEKEAVAFVRDALEAWADGEDTHDGLVARGEKIRATCDDPLVRFLAARAAYRASSDWHHEKLGFADTGGFWRNHIGKAIDDYSKAREGLERLNTYAGAARFVGVEEVIANMRANRWSRAWEVNDTVVELTRTALKDGSYRKDDAGLFISHLYRHPWIRASNRQCMRLGAEFEASEFPEWAKVALRGIRLNEAAASEPDRGKKRQLDREGANLMAKALRLNPSIPEISNRNMVGALVGLGPDGEDEERDWFKVTITAEADYDSAYHDVREVLRPYRGGSSQEILDFGRRTLATKRFDTGVPLQYIHSLEHLRNEAGPGWRREFSTPEIGEDIRALHRGLSEEPSRKGQQNLWHGRCAVFAWIFGDTKLANELMAKLPGGKLPTAALYDLKLFDMTPEEMTGELAMAGSPALEHYRLAGAALEKRDYKEAAQKRTDAARVAPRTPEIRDLLLVQTALIEFEEAYEKGGWVKVPTYKGAWAIYGGKWIGKPDALVSEGLNERTAAFFRGRITSNYELRGEYEISLIPGFKGHPEVGVIVRNSGDPYYWMGFSVWESNRSTQWGTGIREMFYLPRKGKRLPEVPPEQQVDFQLKNTFHLTASSTHLSWELNGRQLFKDVPTTLYNGDKSGARFGLGSPNFQQGQTTTFRNLEVRKRLDAD